MKTMYKTWLLAAAVMLVLATGTAVANPLLEGAINSVSQLNDNCDVEIEFISQVGEFELFLYRTKTPDAYGNVPATADNLVGGVTGDDAYDTETHWDSLSQIYVTTYYYKLTDTYRTSGTWHYQLYCDYGDPGGPIYPLWSPETITLTGCDCDDFVVHNPVTHQDSYNGLLRYSGAAVMSMIIDWLNGTSPPPAQTSFSPAPATSGHTAAQIENILEYHPEIASTTGWSHYMNADRAEVLFQIAYWQNINGIGAAVPTNGDYLHWVVIEGAEADVCPLGGDPNTYGLIGFWVDDPADGKSFKTADEWNDSYYYAPTNGSSFEAVIEPPEEPGSVTIRQAATRAMTCTPKTSMAKHQTRDLAQIYAELRNADPTDREAQRRAAAFKAITRCTQNLMQAHAQDGIVEYDLQSDPTFASAYSNTSASTPVFVDRTDTGGNDYYLVPFIRSGAVSQEPGDRNQTTKAALPAPREDQIKVIVRVDALTGQFLEAKYLVSGGLTMPSADKSWYWNRAYSRTAFNPYESAPCQKNCQAQVD